MKRTHCMILWLSLLAAHPLSFAHGSPHKDKSDKAVQYEQQEWGVAGAAAKVQRVVRVAMSDDMRFTPSLIKIKQGQTIRFMIHNQGSVLHEFVLGTRPVLEAHAELMKRFPDMEHDEPYMAHVMPGQTGEIVWTFNRAGEFDFACLMPGHFEAGMVGRVVVSTQKENSK